MRMAFISIVLLFATAGCLSNGQPIIGSTVSAADRVAQLQKQLDFAVATSTLIHDAGGFNSKQWLAIQTAQAAGQAAINAYGEAAKGSGDATRLLILADDAIKAYKSVAK